LQWQSLRDKPIQSLLAGVVLVVRSGKTKEYLVQALNLLQLVLLVVVGVAQVQVGYYLLLVVVQGVVVVEQVL